jgi:putative transposase
VVKHANLTISSIENVVKLKKIPKQTIYRWLKLYRRYGTSGLENKKPGAKETQINTNFKKIVITRWNKRNKGVHKMTLSLKSSGFEVSERQIQKIYGQHNLKMNKRKRPSQIKFVKYEWPKPNMLWHTDWTTCPYTRKQLIAFIDDHSRFIVHAEYFENATTENTILAFANAINRYGTPENILTDNGPQFNIHGKFEEFCKAKKIKHILGRVHHPQTNGKIERWFGTYKSSEFKQGQDTLQSFVNYYNNERLHQGIGYKIPLHRYKSNINAV